MDTQGNVALQSNVDEKSAPLTLGNYIVMMIVGVIPLVGFVMMLVWAFGSNTNTNKKNWARATLIFAVIMGIIGAICSASIIAMLVSLAGGGVPVQ